MFSVFQLKDLKTHYLNLWLQGPKLKQSASTGLFDFKVIDLSFALDL